MSKENYIYFRQQFFVLFDYNPTQLNIQEKVFHFEKNQCFFARCLQMKGSFWLGEVRLIKIFLVEVMNDNSQNLMEAQKPLNDGARESKQFVYQPFKINYLNTSQVYYKDLEVKDVKIDNFLCYQEDNNLYKVTEISYEDKVVRIEDKFEINAEDRNDILSMKGKFSKNNDKIRIFYQDSFKKLQNNGKMEKKDKKNIVKNIVKIFISWVERSKDQKNTEKLAQVENQMNKMLQAQNFNNRLIKDIINNESVRSTFYEFLRNGAEEQVKYSRIHDKQSHYEAIQVYKKLLEKSLLDDKNQKSLQSHMDQN